MNRAGQTAASATRLALRATIHRLAGCGIGEMLGLGGATVLGSATRRTSRPASCSGTPSVTGSPSYRRSVPGCRLCASGTTFAAETLSTTTMEIVDAPSYSRSEVRWTRALADVLSLMSLAISIALAFVAAIAMNRLLVARGLGHGVLHGARA